MEKISVERPEEVTEEMLDFLDELRDSGATNMFGAGPYVQDEFGLTRQQSSRVVQYWMATFPRNEP